MRKVACILAVCALCTWTANATLLLTDTFEAYNYGDLVPQGGWATHSGTGSPVQVVADNGFTYLGTHAIQLIHGSGSRQDVNKSLGTTLGPGQKFYAAFDVKVDGPLGTGADYFAHFRDVGTGTLFVSKVGVQPDGTGFNFTLTAGAGSTPTAIFPGTFTLGTWHRIVSAYTYDTKLNEVWVDPISEASTEITGTWGGSSSGNCPAENYAFRQGGNGTAIHTVDNLLVGTSFNEVLPEPGSLMLFLGLLGLARRR